MDNAVTDKINPILALIHDPLFIEFELEQEAPSIFNAVGRTHTETWHSALLGWLLDPDSSHSLGLFPLTRLLLFLSIQDTLPIAARGTDLKELLVTGDFSGARVRPSERELTEVSVSDMRFDVFIDGIKTEFWDEVQLLIEVKVKAKISKSQNKKYIDYIEKREREAKTLILPVFVAPASTLGRTGDLGSEKWIGVTYQDINDEIIEPCLQHPSISLFGRFTLSEYVKTLKYRQQGGEPLSTTQKERDMASAILEKHEPAIRALYEILSQGKEPIGPLSQTSDAAPTAISVKVDGTSFQATSVSDLYRKVLGFLEAKRCLEKLELPIATGTKRYLIAREPKHQRGNDFVKPIDHNGYYMEANKSRDSALQDLGKLVKLCGFTLI